MKRSNKNKFNKWKEAQDKAIQMTDKFINVIEQMDCYDSWESIMMERIMQKKLNESGLSGNPDLKDIIDTLQYTFGFRVFKGNSLAEDIKIDEFLNNLKENPYQLNLIA